MTTTMTLHEDGPAAPPALELAEVSVRLGGRQILDRVCFAVAPGEFTGLIGSNGVGKTTLLRVVMGLRTADEGSVRVDGRPRGRRGRRIGYGPQKIQLEPDAPLRARDRVALGLDGERLGPRLPSRQRREAVDRMLPRRWTRPASPRSASAPSPAASSSAC